ncbi:MAG: zinc-dependent metalloprotease, partial [Vicinamibacteria bacterium]
AFEAAGFSNAIIAKDAPDDPNWDAEDVRYSTIRWITSNAPSFGAIGPSRMDPRTGEILDADVLIEGNFMQGFRNTYRRWAGPDAMAQSAFPQLAETPSFLPADLRCDVQAGMLDGAALLRTALLLEGAMPPGSSVPEEFMGDALMWVTLHEVGHTLGLRHNFRSSTATPPDKLQDRAWTKAHGLTGSVMDYVSPNISPDRAKQGEYFSTVPGTYDTWAIRFGYGASGESDLAKDAAYAHAIADESTRPGHEYSTDDDTYPANALDPRTNIYDLSGDPLAWAKERSSYIASLWKNGNFEERILGENGEYPVLRRAMDTLLQQYTIAMGMAVKYVGGQHHSRSHKGQPDALPPLEPVPADAQRAALDFLSERAFAAKAFDVPPTVLNKLAADRWSHWGTQSLFAPTSRVDYNLNDKVFAIQNALLTNLTAAPLLARLREGENRTKAPFTLAEHFDRMTTMLWGDVAPTAAALKTLDGPSTRRQIQRAYVDRLANMVVEDSPGLPDDARALARLQLTRIDSRASRALGGEVAMGDATRAHLLETRARVKRALEAG